MSRTRRSSASAMPRTSPTSCRAIAGGSSPATGIAGSSRPASRRGIRRCPNSRRPPRAVGVATSVGDVLSGRGADLIVIDDPLKPEEALSQAHRQAANEWFDHTLYSRLNDKQRGAIVLIMHRLHDIGPPAKDRSLCSLEAEPSSVA